MINNDDYIIELHSIPTYKLVFTAINKDDIIKQIQNIDNVIKNSIKTYNITYEMDNNIYEIVRERSFVLSINE